MRAVVQRAVSADVTVEGNIVGAIGKGLVVFLGVEEDDKTSDAEYLAEKIAELEKSGEQYILAYEESYGYLVGDGCRDKDAVTATLLIAEMAAYHDLNGMTLYDALGALHEKYGYYCEETLNITMPGINGLADMEKLLVRLGADPPRIIGGYAVTAVRYYADGTRLDLATGEVTHITPSGSDVLYWEIEGGDAFVIRRSGTEPKIRIYMLLHEESREACERKVKALTDAAYGLVR